MVRLLIRQIFLSFFIVFINHIIISSSVDHFFFGNSDSPVTKFVPPGCTNTWLTKRIFTKHIYETKYNHIGCRLIVHNYNEWPCLINTKTFRCMFYTMHYDSLVLCLCCFIYNVVWRHHVCILRFHVYRHESYFPLLTDRIEVLYNQENSQPFKRLTGTRVRVALVTSSDIACPLKWHHISHGFTFWNYRLCLCKKPTKLSYFVLICSRNFKIIAFNIFDVWTFMMYW